MQRVLNGYTKYYNAKYEKSGHLFQGPYQAIHVSSDPQLLHLSAYIHKNPTKWKNYRWSSYSDIVDESRWGDLLKPEIIRDQFKTKVLYQRFVETSLAKKLEEELGVHAL